LSYVVSRSIQYTFIKIFKRIICLIHGKNDFAERSKILLDTDLKIILWGDQNNFVGILKIMSNAAKNFDIPASSLNVLHIYFDNSKLLF